MAILKLYSTNPIDGTSSFDHVRFYEATDNTGTGATLIATTDIDTTTITPIFTGYTTYTHNTGALNKYYASSFYNSVSLAESNKSVWLLGGLDRWDTMFMNEMQDTSSTVWSATDREYFKKKALQALYPDFYRNVVDTSITAVNLSPNVTYSYAVPFGIFSISEVGYGNIDTTSLVSHNFKTIKREYWKFEANKLTFDPLPNFANGDTIRIVAQKKYLQVGEVPEYLDPLVMEHLRMSAYIKMADDFPRFLKWGQLQQGTKVSFENIRVQAREFERRFNDMKKDIKDNAQSGIN